MTNGKTVMGTENAEIQKMNIVAVSGALQQAAYSCAEIVSPIIKQFNAAASYLSDVIAASNVSTFMANFTEAALSICKVAQAEMHNPYSFFKETLIKSSQKQRE